MEESGIIEGKDKDNTFVIDPIDGTSNFIHGIPHVGIIVAKMTNNEITDGVIYNPILNEFVHTVKSPEFGNKIMKRFFFKILKSRVFDKKTFLKLLIRKNRSIKNKSHSLVDKLLYNDILGKFGGN